MLILVDSCCEDFVQVLNQPHLDLVDQKRQTFLTMDEAWNVYLARMSHEITPKDVFKAVNRADDSRMLLQLFCNI